MYADVEVNITDNLELCCKKKSYNDMIPNRNKEHLKNTVQKSTMSKEELENIFILSLSEGSLTVETRPPVLIADTSISNNASTYQIQKRIAKKCKMMIILQAIWIKNFFQFYVIYKTQSVTNSMKYVNP